MKDSGDAEKTDCSSNGTDEKQHPAPDLVDERRRNRNGQQIGEANQNSLKVAGNAIESGLSKDIVQVIENGVYARKLVEHSDRDGEEDRKPISPLKDAFTR